VNTSLNCSYIYCNVSVYFQALRAFLSGISLNFFATRPDSVRKLHRCRTRIHPRWAGSRGERNNALNYTSRAASFISRFQDPRHRSPSRRAPATIVTRRISTGRQRTPSRTSSVTVSRATSVAVSRCIQRHRGRATCPPWDKRRPRARRARS